MSTTNEELALTIQGGQSELAPELWEKIEKFVAKQAGRWLFAFEKQYTGVEYGDLMSCGYLAMVEAVETFSNEKGCSFIGWLNKRLMTHFAVAFGVRTEKQKRDPLHNAARLDAPLDCDDDLRLADTIEDESGAAAIEQLEHGEYIKQLHGALETAMQRLTPEQGEIIHRVYYAQDTLAAIAQSIGRNKQYVQQQREKALRAIRRSQYAQKLLEFYDFDYYSGVTLASFKRTGKSVQERYIENLERAEERELRERFLIAR